MNENINERFGRSRKGFKPPTGQAEVWLLPQQLNAKVREYFETADKPVEGGAWLKRPELPTSAEILDIDPGAGSNSSGDVEIVPNRPRGPWESKEEYLGAMYELLREDAVRPLREAVSHVRVSPTANEDSFDGSVGMYDRVHICGVTPSTRGVAIRVTFSLIRVGKRIRWEQSKRLVTGSLVVLTPTSDMFKTRAIVATVAARPLEGLELNPPEIDLFIFRGGEQELDPAEEFIMVEHRGSLYEADRHTMLALQRMMREPFPLSEHLVNVQAKVAAPKYILDQPKTDMTSVLVNSKHQTYENVDILEGWPTQPGTHLDASQLAALRRTLSKRLAIIQGPPGTGKTYISVQAIRIMLANRKPSDPPIIIACQTNHATDQILRQIAEFEEDFVRLGGRSKDQGIIKSRTLYEVRNLTKESPPAGCMTPNARKKMNEIVKEFQVLLSPLNPGKLPMDFRTLERVGLLSKGQADSLEEGASRWIQTSLGNPNDARSPFTVWLGNKLVRVPPRKAEDFGFEFEEADQAFEALKEIESEAVAKDDEKFEDLSGQPIRLADNFTCNKVAGMSEAKVKDALRQQNMWDIPEALRPAIYRYLQAEFKKMLLPAFREKTKVFNELAAKRRIGMFEKDETILKKQKIIGMTTTGLSKYRGLIAALQPKIVLIEEAAEILEAPVTVACMPSVQHLILVGDHKQLRPHCHVRDHEDKPFYLNVSLFERLVKNNVEFDTLSKQRRMIPEVRRILHPIYKDLIKDHASVLDREKRPNVPGMGGVNSFFFTHQWPEQRDEQMSAFNPDEAEMIIGFVEYLIYNGMEGEGITILTFYNGQRKKILSGIRDAPALADVRNKINIVTVDSYQGEENKVVILSLVRSNDKGQIGFLNIDNRVCVALSRAQCGFYIFGNGMLLHNTNPTWKKVINIMANKGPGVDRIKVEPAFRLGDNLPVRCKNHNNVTEINDASDWEKISGGCADVKCKEKLPCGHPCPLLCHPIPHEYVICRARCGKPLTCCDNVCEEPCGEDHKCKIHNKKNAPAQITNMPHQEVEKKVAPSNQSSPESWKSFSRDEPKRYAVAASAPPSSRVSPQKNELLELVPEDDMQQLSLGASSRPQCASPAGKPEKGGKRGKWVERSGPVDLKPGDRDDWSKKESLLD